MSLNMKFLFFEGVPKCDLLLITPVFSHNKYFQVILGSAEEVPCEVIQDVPGLFRLQDHEEPQPGSYVHVGL